MVEERPDHLPWSKKNKKEIENDNLVTFEFLKPTISSQFVSDLPLDENDFTFIEDGLIRIYPTKGELKMGEKSTIEITLSPSINLPGVKLAIEKRQETILANEAEYANEMAKRDAEIKERDIASAMASKKKGVPKAKQVVEEEKVVIEIPALVKKDAPAMDFFKSYRDSKVTLIVPCKTRIIESEASRQKRFVNGSKTPIKQTPIQSIEEHIIYLSITAVVCKPEFVVEQWPDSAVNDEKSANPTTQLKMGKIDFGIIPVYEHSVKKMKLKSNGFKVDLKSNLFDLKGPFYLAKALREFDISESVHFGFKPEIVGKFQTNTRLFSNGTQVSINMIGEGVIPSLLLEPLKGKLLFADKLIGEVSNGTFKVHNPCHFPISCKFQINDEGAFTLSPTETVIPPGARQEVEVQFKPIRESDFLTIVKIQYLGQQKDCLFSLAGRGWEISATLLGYDEISQGISKNFATEGEGETLSRPQSREMSMQSIPLALQSTVQIPNSIATRIDVRYVTYSCSWKKVDDSDLNNITTYTIEAPEISITNFKPTAKLENVGGNTKATSASFTIERITSGFEYNEDTGLIKITNLENSKKQSYKFEIEPMTGAVEIGGMKNLAIKIVKIDSEKVDNESVADKKKKPVKNEEVRPSTDITEPLNVESFFRIKIRGGYRASEPKGIFADKRDFIVRLVV